MKRQKPLSIAAFALLVAVASCKKDNNSGPNSQLSATVSGTVFNPSVVHALSEPDFIVVFGTQAKSGDSLFLELAIPDTARVNMPVSFENTDVAYFNFKGTFYYASWLPPSHGTITLNTYDKSNKEIAGSFSGVLYGNGTDSMVITNGQFNTTYK